VRETLDEFLGSEAALTNQRRDEGR